MDNHLTVCKQMTDVEFVLLRCNNWNYLCVNKWDLACLKSNLQTICLQITYSICMYKQNLALNNQQGLICNKTPTNQQTIILCRVQFYYTP